MQFRYRHVPYGTDFTSADGVRTEAKTNPARYSEPERDADAGRLYANELVVDVGGQCWGCKGEQQTILDHHFFRAGGQFPSAAAAVLHNAHRVWERFHALDGDLWLVTHANPDFDAFCALYLARRLFEPADPARPESVVPHEGWDRAGLKENGWFGDKGEINWFQPYLHGLRPEQRWPVLLAAHAAVVDNCRRIPCPPERALHSVLYAALHRGRGYGTPAAGAEEFFDEVRTSLVENGLHPFFDSVLEDSAKFAPELRLLDQEIAAYRRDLRCARRTLVYVRATNDFDRWYSTVQGKPLLDAAGKLNRAHLDLASHTPVLADGIYIRDPECILFKEWARTDTENSSMGAGFLFTAVAYSDGRPGAWANKTDYYFALDPERARGAHLYNVWARLQAEDMAALARTKPPVEPTGKPPRYRFEERAKGPFEAFFDDPWFDGANYKCTIVPTPNRGTFIRPEGGGPATARDLRDDPVARVVQEELEYAIYTSDLRLQDYAASHKRADPAGQRFPVSAPPRPVPADGAGGYRFCRADLHDQVDVLAGSLAEHVGRALWRHLHPEDGPGVPADFLQQHVHKSKDWVGVWSPRGVAVACKNCAPGMVDEQQKLFAELTALARDLETLTELMDQAEHATTEKEREEKTAAVLAQGEADLRRVAGVKRALARPENQLLSRFFEASRLDEVLKTLRDVYLAAVQRAQTEKLTKNTHEVAEIQGKLEWVEVFIIAFYALELAYHVGHVFHYPDAYLGWGVIVTASVAMLLAFVLLKPYQHTRTSKAKQAGILLLIVGALVVYLLGGEAAKRRPAPAVLGPPGEAKPAAGAEQQGPSP